MQFEDRLQRVGRERTCCSCEAGLQCKEEIPIVRQKRCEVGCIAVRFKESQDVIKAAFRVRLTRIPGGCLEMEKALAMRSRLQSGKCRFDV